MRTFDTATLRDFLFRVRKCIATCDETYQGRAHLLGEEQRLLAVLKAKYKTAVTAAISAPNPPPTSATSAPNRSPT